MQEEDAEEAEPTTPPGPVEAQEGGDDSVGVIPHWDSYTGKFCAMFCADGGGGGAEEYGAGGAEDVGWGPADPYGFGGK